MPYHHGDLARALVAAARERLGRSPEADLSLRDLARRLGVSAAAPYRHYPDREALLRAVAADGYRSVREALGERRGAAAVARAWSGLAAAEPRLAALMTTTPPGDDPLLDAAIKEWLGAVAAAIEAEVGGDDPAAVLTLAVACWAAVHGVTSLRAAGVIAGIDDWLLPTPTAAATQVLR